MGKDQDHCGEIEALAVMEYYLDGEEEGKRKL
jgi:hypothetical protein